MPIDINGTVLTGGTSLKAQDSVGNILYHQNAAGQVFKPTTSSGTPLTPMFMVGMSAAGWTQPVASGSFGVLPFNYSGGSGYLNVGNCYNLTNYRFTAPWTGLYLFKVMNYIYGVSGAVITHYCHPMFYVNGSINARRGGGGLYRMRQYGFPASFGHDTDLCELIYLSPGDYVEAVWYANGTMQAYEPYCSFCGCYMSN